MESPTTDTTASYPSAAATPASATAESSGVSGEQVRGGGEQLSGGGADPPASASDTEGDDDPRTAVPSSSSPSSSHARRPVAFQTAHALKFGLEVVARDALTSAPPRVTAVLCLFCKHFGREPKAGAKRRATTNFKYFKGVFRTDQYLQHHRLQHPTKWAEYDAASVREKQAFFPHCVMFDGVNSVGKELSSVKLRSKKQRRTAAVETGDEKEAAHGERKAMDVQPKEAEDMGNHFEIPLQVVSLLLGDQRWEPQSLPQCELSSVIAEEHRSGQWMVRGAVSVQAKTTEDSIQVYRGVVPDRRSFDLVVELVGTGFSSRQTVRALQAMAKHIPNGAVLASMWPALVDDYSQVATLSSLTLLSSLLTSSWAFSIGFHRHDDENVSAVDVRVRFLHATLHDFHLCSLHVDDAQTKLAQVLTVVWPNWTHTLMGISIAGDVSALAALSPTIRWLSSSVATPDTLYVTWDGDALLRRAFLQFFQQLQNGEFATTFDRLKAFVKSQARLIQEIGHEPQSVGGSSQHFKTHGESMRAVIATAHWFTAKRVRIRKFLEDESVFTTNRPSEAWWLCLAIFDWIATPAAQALETISVRLGRLVPTEQLVLLKELDTEVSSAFQLREPVGSAVATKDEQSWSQHGSVVATKSGMLEFIVELGSFVDSLLTGVHHDELSVTLESLGTSVATFVETLRTGVNHGLDYVKGSGGLASSSDGAVVHALSATPSPVLPQDFVKLNGKEFSALLGKYRPQLRTRFSDEELDTLEQDHLALKRAIREKDFRAWTSDTPVDRREQFDTMWAKTTGRFRMLHAFAGGLASVLPRGLDQTHTNVDTVRGLPQTTEKLDMETEGPRHAVQFHELQRLWRLQALV